MLGAAVKGANYPGRQFSNWQAFDNVRNDSKLGEDCNVIKLRNSGASSSLAGIPMVRNDLKLFPLSYSLAL